MSHYLSSQNEQEDQDDDPHMAVEDWMLICQQGAEFTVP